MMKSFLTFLAILLFSYPQAQSPQTKKQDSTINNLKLPKGYQTSEIGKNIPHHRIGEGSQEIILISGWGFDSSIFNEFVKRNKNEYTLYLVTLPGFGSTMAPPIVEGQSYGTQSWTKSAEQGIVELIMKEDIKNPIIVGHFLTSTQVALRLAIDHPKLIKGVLIAAGSPRVGNSDWNFVPTLEQRIQINDSYYGPKWFKTVSKKNWDDGNYPAELYSTNSTVARHYWNTSASALIPVMIQYLLEYYASDITLEFDKITVPVLALVPKFNDELFRKYNYLKSSFYDPWMEAEKFENIKVKEVEDSGFMLMNDRLELFESELKDFTTSLK